MGGVGHVMNMLFRVEENLSLLAPVRNETRAIISGVGGLTLNNSSEPVDDNSIFYAAKGTTFDQFYCSLMLTVIKISVDEPLNSTSDNIEELLRVSSGIQIKSAVGIKLINELLKCEHMSLVSIGVKAAFLLVKMNPLNIVALEKFDVIQSLLICLIGISLFGKHEYCFNFKKTTELTESPATSTPRPSNSLVGELLQRESSGDIDHLSENTDFDTNLNVDALHLLEEILQILQIVCAFYAKRDESIVSSILLIMLVSWSPMETNLKIHGKDCFRCANCEVESAAVECLCQR